MARHCPSLSTQASEAAKLRARQPRRPTTGSPCARPPSTVGAFSMEQQRSSAQDDPGKAARVLGVHYRRITKGRAVVGTWTEKGWRCEHGRRRSQCKKCGGIAVRGGKPPAQTATAQPAPGATRHGTSTRNAATLLVDVALGLQLEGNLEGNPTSKRPSSTRAAGATPQRKRGRPPSRHQDTIQNTERVRHGAKAALGRQHAPRTFPYLTRTALLRNTMVSERACAVVVLLGLRDSCSGAHES